jgi:hypothetical protein
MGLETIKSKGVKQVSGGRSVKEDCKYFDYSFRVFSAIFTPAVEYKDSA